jgi:Cellulose biosynthesis protein BcsS
MSLLGGAVRSVAAQDMVRAGTHNRGQQTHDASADQTPDDIWATREHWAGAERVGRALSFYSGATFAVGGSTLNESGWRLRSVSGHGRSSFPGVMWVGGHAYPVTVHAQTGFSDLLAGYQWGEATRFGHLTVKAFIGGTMAYDKVVPSNAVGERGLHYGGKGQLETWLDITDRSWLSADVTVASAKRSVGARTRYGWRMIPGLSVGPEASFGGGSGSGTARAGGFARLEWGAGDWWSGELSAAGGLALTAANPATADPITRRDPYANVNLLLRY